MAVAVITFIVALAVIASERVNRTKVALIGAAIVVLFVGGEYDQEALASVLDHELINQAAASLYRDRCGETAGIVYAAGVEHAYNLAREFRAVDLKAEAVSPAGARRPRPERSDRWPRAAGWFGMARI